MYFDYTIKKNICTVKCKDVHSHGTYKRIHLSGDDAKEFIEKVKQDPLTTPKKMTTGISSCMGEIVGAARNIDPVLSNQDRVKYEMNKVRGQLNISKSSEFLGKFTKIRKEFDGFITYAQVTNEKGFLLSFSPPDIKEFGDQFH
ncbi:uncharacterized protein B0P05DRAFT_575293 [Gilbertella persicaria]|uniref:uncharacterized protein n=1 Tax=Gilbertella persicaria TaxID=101096 RepID=UPI00221F079C|nr:uncharacterized protein B0P05DRAFT_575293 [Gilbertella persicaria]KAI8055563.1 hypothetical protein B0P05DRAFT_575293 [Gilbertella persicaria]